MLFAVTNTLPIARKRIAFYCLLLIIICSLQEETIADTDVLPRHPREHIAGITYESLGDLFQSYPVDRRNTDQTWKLLGSCSGLSGQREILHASSGQVLWRVAKPCYSILQNCRFDESMKESSRFCRSEDSHRRYDYLEIGLPKKYMYGQNFRKKCPSAKYESYFSYGPYYPCVCDCESSEREVDRYFSLLDVVADEGKVVTGVRFRKIDHVFYIQIQQAELGWNGLIRNEAEWKAVRKVSRSELLSSNVSEYYKQGGSDDNLLKFHKNDLVYAVTSQQNTILLDNLVGDQDEVLTGLRFRQVGQDLQFEIQVTPFDDVTAILDRKAKRWIYNNIDKGRRLEVQLVSAKVPGKQEGRTFLSFGYQSIKFQVSDFRTDLGQTTVPFIDITDVVPEQPRAFFGAGILHRVNNESAGYIALQLTHK